MTLHLAFAFVKGQCWHKSVCATWRSRALTFLKYHKNSAPDNSPIPDSTLPTSLNRRPLLGYIWVRGPQSLAANSTAFMEWKVARSSAWTW
jgi:hypothetical protein